MTVTRETPRAVERAALRLARDHERGTSCIRRPRRAGLGGVPGQPAPVPGRWPPAARRPERGALPAAARVMDARGATGRGAPQCKESCEAACCRRSCPPRASRASPLVDQVLGRLDGRLVTIVAGAGYGKTTLLRLTVDRLEWPWVWCSCDERIGDGGLLLRHLAAGFAGTVSRLRGSPLRDGFGTRAGRGVLQRGGGDRRRGRRAGARRRAPPAEADARGRSTGCSATCRGRRTSPSRGASRCRSGSGACAPGRMLEIGEGELAFTQEEAASLLEAVGLTLDPEELARLHGEVEGWVAGLIMAAQAGRRARPGRSSSTWPKRCCGARTRRSSDSCSPRRCSTASPRRWPRR